MSKMESIVWSITPMCRRILWYIAAMEAALHCIWRRTRFAGMKCKTGGENQGKHCFFIAFFCILLYNKA